MSKWKTCHVHQAPGSSTDPPRHPTGRHKSEVMMSWCDDMKRMVVDILMELCEVNVTFT